MTPAAGFVPNLTRRILTALVGLPLLVAVIFLGPPYLSVAVVAGAGLVGLLEFFRLVETRGLEPMRFAGTLLAAAFFLDLALPYRTGLPLWPLAAVLLFCGSILPGRDLIDRVPSLALSLLGAGYLGMLCGTLAALRVLPPLDLGPWRMVLLLAIVMVSDTLAFFVGHAVGRHRLAPGLSPGKTVEGALGGFVGGILGALAVRGIGFPSLPLLHTLLLGTAVTALGIFGDLHESLLKRWAGVKDSGSVFPGHGGMLDRIDGLLFGAAILYYYFSYVG